MNIEKLIRPCVKNFAPYIAGRPVEAVKKQFNLKKVIKLASNENPLGPSREAVNAIVRNINNIHLYPDSDSFELRTAIAKKYKLPVENILVGGGSDEIIEIIAKTFFVPSDEIIVSKHAFIRYKMAGDLMSSEVIEVPMKNFTHDLVAMAKAVTKKTKAIFVANPNNPTGTYNTKQEFDCFLSQLLTFNSQLLIVVDEAYYEYARINADYPDTIKYLKKYSNLIILRTFSKIYGLAGLRLGYAFASEPIVKELNKIRPPFNVSYPAQLGGVAALSDEKHLKKSVEMVESGKLYIYDELDKIGVSYIRSATNFILIDVSPQKGTVLFNKLLRQGVIVRAMDEYGLPNHIRVTVGLSDENKKFIKELKRCLKKGA